MWTISKFFILCLSFCLVFACTSDGGDDADAGTDTDTGTGTDTDTGTGTEEPDTTEGMDACEIMEITANNAVTDYCVDNIDVCCYCQCYDQGQEFDSEEYFDNENCVCVDDEDPEPVCEDAYLEMAEDCVADLELCYQTFYDSAETGCLMTPL